VERKDASPDVTLRIGTVVVSRRTDADLDRCLRDGQRKNLRCLELLPIWFANLSPTSGDHLVGKGGERGQALIVPIDAPECSEEDSRAVVCGMFEGGAGKDETVEDRDRQACRHTGGKQTDGAACRRAVNIDGSLNTGVEHRDAKRLIVLHESDMGDVAGVKDAVDRSEVVAAARRLTPYVRPLNDPPYVSFDPA